MEVTLQFYNNCSQESHENLSPTPRLLYFLNFLVLTDSQSQLNFKRKEKEPRAKVRKENSFQFSRRVIRIVLVSRTNTNPLHRLKVHVSRKE